MWSLSLRQGTTMDTAGAALSLAIIFNSSLALFAALREMSFHLFLSPQDVGEHPSSSTKIDSYEGN